MPRPKSPDYKKYFEIICEGIGRTREQALYNHNKDVVYVKKWVRGHVHSVVPEIDTLGIDGKYIYKTRVTFYDRKYLTELEDKVEKTQEELERDLIEHVSNPGSDSFINIRPSGRDSVHNGD